ncbi:ankyrin repeat domain-containing protein SOWAHB-like [Scyliorhinus torazame]|uniref:SOWAHA-C winged helix-turn-helix domain-containing protein n=1 Tax=Scyliorhinus torazame TaxID=75743 RepID=A0A401NK81_SCYTO|nr:hypothetical protein [Scyliorhinus torazame]
MAATFSQEAVLDFLLLHHGKVRNVDLTAHFSRFLKDPQGRLQSRDKFKKFVNSLAVVKVEGGDKYIVLKKRYVELIPEEVVTSSDADVPVRPEREEEEEERQRAAQCTQSPPSAAGQLAEIMLLRAQQRHEEATALKGSKSHLPARALDKTAPEEFAKLPAGAVQERKAIPTVLRDGNCTGKASDCSLVRREGCSSPLEPIREGDKRANADQSVRQRNPGGVINKRGGSALGKSAERRSGNFKSKNRRSPVAPSHCTDDTVNIFNGDSRGGSNSTDSPTLSRLTTPPTDLKCKGNGEPLHGPPPDYNTVIISDVPVTENLRYKRDRNLLENFTKKSKQRFQRAQRQGSASTHQNKTINHWKNPSSPKEHGSTDQVQEKSPGLLNGSDTKVLVNSAICKEECIQKNQRKLSQQQCRTSAGSGQRLGNKWQSILPKMHKSSLKKIVTNNGLPHKMPTRVSNKSTAPKIVDRGIFLHKSDQPVSLTQAESHSECSKEDPLKIEAASEKPLIDSTEHEWMVKTAVGKFDQAFALFCEDPNIAMKKDFISGYTVLHWIAKHGNHRALSRFISAASKMKVKLNVDIKSTCGYTPLHIAVIHERLKVIQFLVKKYQANVNLRDHSGKKPWQYLSSEFPKDMCRMLGAPEYRHTTENNSAFLAKNINKQGTSPAISRKTSFTALLKSPRVLQKFKHRDSGWFHTVTEDNEQD